MTRPPWITATRSHMRSTSDRRCEFEQHGGAALARRDDQVAHLTAADRVEVGRRFVEHEQLRLVQERLGERQSLEHPFGELTRLPAATDCSSDEAS